MRVLRRIPQCERAHAGIVFADRGARLDGVGHQAIIDDVELGDVLGRLERGIGCFGVAEAPLIDGVVRRDVVDARRALLLRSGGVGDRRQHRVIDFDLLGGVARPRQRLADHDGDRVADMAGFAIGKNGMRRHFHRRAILGVDHPAADQIADLVAGELRAGEHREHAGHGGGGFGVDRFDRRVRMRRADEIGKSLARPVDVVGVMARAGDEAAIFLATHRCADTGSTHWHCLRRFALPQRNSFYSAALLVAPVLESRPFIARAPAAMALTMLW